MSTTQRMTELKLAPGGVTVTGRSAATLWLKSVWYALRNRMSANRLSEFDDRSLADIGLTRNDIDKALLRTGFFEDPTTLLSRSARANAVHRFNKTK